MGYERELNGVLYENNNRQSDNHPNMRGFVTVNGVNYEIGAWNRVSPKGPYIKLSLRVKEGGTHLGATVPVDKFKAPQPVTANDGLTDESPF